MLKVQSSPSSHIYTMAAPWRTVTQEEEADRASPLVAAPHRGLCPAGRPPPSALVINSSPTATARHNSHDRSKSALYELLICSKTAPRGHHHCQAPQTLLFAPHHQPTQLLSMSVKDGFGGPEFLFIRFLTSSVYLHVLRLKPDNGAAVGWLAFCFIFVCAYF